MLRHDARKRPLLELRTRAEGGFDTVKTYRYTQSGDTTWEYTTAPYGRLEAERNFTEDHGRVFRYDRLHYRHPKYAPEAPLYLDEVKSYYSRHDRKGRQVESGEVNYQPALEEWIARRTDQRQDLPGGLRGFVYGGGMYQLQLSGRLRGVYRPSQRIFYDKQGRLSATWNHYSDGLRRFIYNGAGQVVEIQFFIQGQPNGPPSAPSGSVLLTWGTAGLPIRVERRNAAGEPDQISTYTYAYHLTLPGAGR